MVEASAEIEGWGFDANSGGAWWSMAVSVVLGVEYGGLMVEVLDTVVGGSCEISSRDRRGLIAAVAGNGVDAIGLSATCCEASADGFEPAAVPFCSLTSRAFGKGVEGIGLGAMCCVALTDGSEPAAVPFCFRTFRAFFPAGNIAKSPRRRGN